MMRLSQKDVPGGEETQWKQFDTSALFAACQEILTIPFPGKTLPSDKHKNKMSCNS
jgi:hypothetical protein